MSRKKIFLLSAVMAVVVAASVMSSIAQSQVQPPTNGTDATEMTTGDTAKEAAEEEEKKKGKEEEEIEAPVEDTDDTRNKTAPLPRIIELKPHAGGVEGDAITLVGENFGTDRSKIIVTLRRSAAAEGNNEDRAVRSPATTVRPGSDEEEITAWQAKIRSLSKPDEDKENRQELSFAIPTGASNGRPLVNYTKVSVQVGDQQSNDRGITVLGKWWRYICAAISIAVVLAILIPVVLPIYLLVRSSNRFRAVIGILFLDRKTNKYSLSKFQALGWTIVLLWSYFYLVIGKWLIVGLNEIPDFNPSLVILMSITYGGLVTSRSVQNRNARNDLEGSPRSFTNLFTEAGEVSLPRLQLFGFTCIAWIVYVGFMMFSTEVFAQGLPNVPANLLALLGVSQGGYLAGKVAAGSLAVNLIVPRRVGINHRGKIDVVLSGTGFRDNTKVMFGNTSKLINTTKESDNALSFSLPAIKSDRAPGWNQLTVVPPTGASTVVDQAVEFVDGSAEVTPDADKKKLELKLTGFHPEDVVCTADGTVLERCSTNLAETAKKTAERISHVTFLSKTDLAAGANVVVSSGDTYLKAETTIP